MAWLRGIALVVLLALSGTPVGATMCALLCAVPSMSDVTHHGSEQCEASARSTSGPQIIAMSEHDCSSHAAIDESAATGSERAFAIVKSVLPVGDTTRRELVTLLGARGALDDAPPGSAPPTTRPTVLRI